MSPVRSGSRTSRWLLATPVAALTSVLLLLSPVQAFWSSTSAANGTGAGKATSVNAGSTPSVSLSGATVTVTWSATTLASGAAVTGYDLNRYDSGGNLADPQNGCSGTVTATSCTETDVPEGTWRYTVTPVIGTDWTGAESSTSTAVVVDVTAPTASLALSNVSGSVSLSGTTVYYNGTSAGSFTLTDTVTDSRSGPASSTTAALGGTTTGWSHTPSTVTTPTGGPYVSAAFSWTAGTTSRPTETVTASDAAGNTTPVTLSFVENSTAPTGTISYVDGYSSGRSVSVSFTTTSHGSPVSSTQLQRARASLRNGVCGSFGAFANLGAANPSSPYVDGPNAAGACYRYQLLITDQTGNTGTATSTATARIGYAGAVLATTGVADYWRLGENAATATDSFTGTAGVALQERTGELGATWTRHPASKTDAVLTASGRVRKDGTTVNALYSSSGVPLTADYRVSADLYSGTVLTNDRAGVVGRLDTSVATYYLAAYDRASNAYTLSSVVNGGTPTVLGTSAATFAAGETHRIVLDMVGSTIRVLADGVQVISVTDSSITAIGRGGILLGAISTSVTDSDTYGFQLDSYAVGPVLATPGSADAKGSNTGSYVGGVSLGQTGVLAGDADTAAGFDGTDDYMQVASPSGLPTGSSARTVEMWFKTTSANRVVLFNYGSPSTNAEFGLWLNAGGKGFTSWAGGSGSNATWTLGTAVNNGAWHQAVLVYTGTVLSLYVDGAAVSPSVTATRSTTVDSTGFVVGAVLAANQTGASGGYFAGTLDEVSVYAGAVPAATIADHYALASPYQDVDGPTGGSVDGTALTGADGRYRTTTSVTLNLAKGSDPSGLAGSGAQLVTLKATLSNNTCGTFDVSGATVADPASSYTATLATGACYRFRYLVPDTLGNTTTYTSPNIKVDTTAPAASSLTSSTAGTNAYRTGTTVYYRSAAASGTITLTGKGSDSYSGIASYAWPALGTGWSMTTASTQLVTNSTVTYSWSAAAPAAPGTVAFNDTNYAGLASTTGSSLTFTDDATAPTGGSVGYTDGRTTATTIPVSFTTGSDAGSGLSTTKTVLVAKAPVIGGVCGTFGAYATVSGSSSTTLTSPYTASIATADTCYKFAYQQADKVGNVAVFYSDNVVRREGTYASTVLATSGIVDFWRLGEASGATSAVDAKGGDNNGTYVGAPTLGVSGALVDDTDTAATFDGATQYVSAARNLSTTFSIELWLRTTQTTGGTSTSWSGNAALVDSDATGNANDFGLSMTSSGAVTAGTGSSSAADTTLTSAAGLNDGQWHQVVLTRTSAGALVLYVDGVQAATATGTSAALTAGSALTLARAASGGRWWAGSLDEVSTYTAALAAATVASHYNAGK